MKNKSHCLKIAVSALVLASVVSIGCAAPADANKAASTATIGERTFTLTGDGATSIEAKGQYVSLKIGPHNFLAESTTLRLDHEKIVKLSPASKTITIDINQNILTVTVNGKQTFTRKLDATETKPESVPETEPKSAAETKPMMQIAIADEAAFFAALDLERPDMAAVKTAVAARNWDAAKAAWARHLETRTSPKWLWSRADKAKIESLLAQHGDDLSSHVAPADLVLARKFNPQGEEYQLDKNISWRLKRSEETHVLSRFAYFKDLGLAHWKTGDDKYAADFTYILEDWIKDNPVPNDLSLVIKSGQPWRSLEAGIRTVEWWNTLQLFMDAPEFDAQTKYLMTKSLMEHARYLYGWTPKFRGGNWQMSEAGGVAVTGIMLPEARESAAWRERGLLRLTEHSEKDVVPDGGHSELTPDYHLWVMDQFANIAQLARSNDIDAKALTTSHEKMYDWLMKLSQPNSVVPAIGDTHGPLDIRDKMATGALLYNRPDMKFLGNKDGPASWVWLFGADAFERYAKVATQKPALTSALLPDSKYITMRSGWDKSDSYLLFDAAPGGVAHHHQDRLQVLVHAGRDLLIDPGIYSYNQPLSTTYFKLAEAHNIALIDGKGSPRSKDEASFPQVLAWQSAPDADFASASTTFDGFTQQRSVVFVKPNYWIVVDHITGAPDDNKEHEIKRLFHFPIGAIKTEDNNALTTFADGMNIQISAAADAKLEMSEGWFPTEGAKAEPAPIANYVSTGRLPMTLITVLTPFANANALPKIENLTGESPSARVRLTFPDGQSDEIIVAAAPTTLGGKTGRALITRTGPQYKATMVLAGSMPAAP